jgi:membrane protein YdbS with pleckstrin-like domain
MTTLVIGLAGLSASATPAIAAIINSLTASIIRILAFIAPYNAPRSPQEAIMFENAEVSVDNLPRADVVDWQLLDPKFKRMLQVQVLLALGVIAIPLTVISIFAEIPARPTIGLWVNWAIILVIALCWPIISVPKRGYVVRDKDILFKKGVVWRSVTAVPFNRIQHVETSHTPLDRKFDLATLQLFTAGGTGGDLKIDGLPADTAEQLRVFILKKAGSSIEHVE